jgi:hypothetical protein
MTKLKEFHVDEVEPKYIIINNETPIEAHEAFEVFRFKHRFFIMQRYAAMEAMLHHFIAYAE